MIALETDEVILRSLTRRDTAADCGVSAAAFDYGGKEGCFALVKKATGAVIGVVLCPGEELMMEILPTERDLGFGGDGLTLALCALFGLIGRERVTAFCAEENTAAVKTLLRCGFRRGETAAGRVSWSLTEEEWERL